MTIATADVSEDARIVLALLGTRQPHVTYTAADICALHPHHPGLRLYGDDAAPSVPMDEGQVDDALDELSRPGGWLGHFSPNRYVFRALAPDLRVGAAAR